VPRRLRIGLFTNNYLPMLGGVTRAVETVRVGLERLGHTVVVIAPGMVPEAGDSGVLRVPALPAPTYPEFSLPLPFTPRLDRRVRDLSLDVFHAQHPFLLGATARRLARTVGRPLVFTYHTLYDRYAHYVPLPPGPVARMALAWSTRFANAADLVIAPSEALAERIKGQGVRRRVEVVPTGIDLDRFEPGDRAGARAALGLPAEGPLLAYVGRLDREKNLPLLLEAFAHVSARIPEARLLLVGRGRREGQLRDQVARLGALDRVRFVGGVAPEDVVTYYQAADLFVFASTTETQGLAVLEAMAVGRPVVAVRASGVEEAVLDGVTGLLTAEDPSALASAAVEVLEDPGLAAKLATGGREAAHRFAAPALASRLASLYDGLIGSGSFQPKHPTGSAP
jgi:glycosyltransferase involved in cell wall biosynthesis